MNIVQPIRDKKVIEEFKEELLKRSTRDYLLFVIGINTGFRIGDILKLQVKNVSGAYISIREEKTNKARRALINPQLKKIIDKYIKGMDSEVYLFTSRQGGKPISTVQAYRILNGVGDYIGVGEIGTHTLRKTFGYHHYQQYKDIGILQQILNHSNPRETMRYIGITGDMIDATIQNFYI